MKEIIVKAVVALLIECLIQHHRTPLIIVSDRGPQFVSLMWKQICSLIRITRRLLTAFHPETDGSTKWMNQELEAYL
jgi:transposase InsO family protein